MKATKIIIFCLSAFILPVLLAVFLIPEFFFSANSNNSKNINSSPDDARPESENSTDIVTKSYVEVPSSDELDPAKEGVFFASLKFSFSELPSEGQSIRLFTKYDEQNWPHAGWGLKIKRQAGSIRPEVYWMGTNSRGGWYSFGEIDLKENHWSALTLVVERNNSISVFFQDLSNQVDATGILLPKFVGGFTVAEIPIPKNNGNLKILAPVSSKVSDKIAIHDLLLARFKQSEEAILQLVNGGPSELAQKIKSEDISLWIDARGRDRSSYARKVNRAL